MNIRWWRSSLASSSELTLPHPKEWLQIYFVVLAKIISYAAFQLNFHSFIPCWKFCMYKQSDFCSLKLSWQYLQKSGWSNGKIIRFSAKASHAVHSRLLRKEKWLFTGIYKPPLENSQYFFGYFKWFAVFLLKQIRQ